MGYFTAAAIIIVSTCSLWLIFVIFRRLRSYGTSSSVERNRESFRNVLTLENKSSNVANTNWCIVSIFFYT